MAGTQRPQLLADFIGQEEIKRQLRTAIAAAMGRGEVVEHILFHGPPGLGKTTLAQIIANETQGVAHMLSGPTLRKPADVMQELVLLQDGDVLFIDELHRAPRAVQEILYPAMEDYVTFVTVGSGASAHTVSVGLNKFTLIGATTRSSLLTPPLLDRFGFHLRLQYYTKDELVQIIERYARLEKIKVDKKAVHLIATRSRGTARVALRLLRRVRDEGQVNQKPLDVVLAEAWLEEIGIDKLGLDELDRKILTAVALAPVGIRTLAGRVGEDAQTIEEIYEPYLLRAGLLEVTDAGRLATPLALRHLGIDMPDRRLSMLDRLRNAFGEEDGEVDEEVVVA